MKKAVFVMIVLMVLIISCAPVQPVNAGGDFPGIETRITYKLFRVVDDEAGVVCYLWAYANASGQMECMPIETTDLNK